MPDTSVTQYYHKSKTPIIVKLEQGDKTTLLVSEASISQTPHQPPRDLSVTQINEPKSRSEVDDFFSNSETTWTELYDNLSFNAAFDRALDTGVLKNKERLAFLARKYARRISKEEEARLDILTEQVRALIPRITERDYEQLADIANELSTIRQDNEHLREKLKTNTE